MTWSADDDTMTISGHGLSTGDSVIYGNGGGATLDGLTDATTYFAIRVDADTIKLATSESNADAGTAIDSRTPVTMIRLLQKHQVTEVILIKLLSVLRRSLVHQQR